MIIEQKVDTCILMGIVGVLKKSLTLYTFILTKHKEEPLKCVYKLFRS
jgi:hypothetical protein